MAKLPGLVYSGRNYTFRFPMAPTETELLRLALFAYEAASAPELWPRFLEMYSRAVSSEMTLLQNHDLALNRSTIFCAFGFSSPLQQSYNEHYSKMNVWREGGRARYFAGAVNLDQEQCSRPVFERSEFYNDYLRRMDAAYSMGAVIERRGHEVPTLTALRGRHKGEFGEEERRIAKFVLPYLARAWTVHEKLEQLAAGESVLGGLPVGIVFLGPAGAVIYSNRCADVIFRANDGISLRGGMICATDRIADAQIRNAIHHAVSPGWPPGQRAVTVARPSYRRAYQVVVAPLRARIRQFVGLPAPRSVLLISDPEGPTPNKVDLMVQLYGLSPKEAEIAAKLSEAKSLEQAAEEMRMSYQTARTHLRHVFGKTGTSRQTELVLLLAKLPGGDAG